MEKAVKRYVNPYVNPLPAEIKSVGIVGYSWYTRHARFSLYRNVSLDIRVDKYNIGNKTVESTNNVITFSKDF